MAPDYLRQSISVLPPSKYDLRLLIVLWCSAKTRKINLMVHYVLCLLRSEAEMRLSHKRNRKKWKRSDSSDSDYVALMTLLTTPILIFTRS